MMKLLALVGAVLPVAFAATCGNITNGGSRPKAFDCGLSMSYNAVNSGKTCPSRGCTQQLCCVAKKAETKAETTTGSATNANGTKVKAQELDVFDPEERICGAAIMGSRKSRHACAMGYTFDENRYYEPCGDRCTDSMCCKEDLTPQVPNPWDCYSDEAFSPAKKSFCCITQKIGCAQHSCAWGAGIMSDDGSTCCNAACGECGGDGCFYRGGAGCCKSLIATMNRPCSMYSAPCSMLQDGPFRRSAPASPPMFLHPFPMEAPGAPFPHHMAPFPHLMPAMVPQVEVVGFPIFF